MLDFKRKNEFGKSEEAVRCHHGCCKQIRRGFFDGDKRSKKNRRPRSRGIGFQAASESFEHHARARVAQGSQHKLPQPEKNQILFPEPSLLVPDCFQGLQFAESGYR